MIRSFLIKMFVVIFLLIPYPVLGQTISTSAADQDIKVLKEKIATKVAELRQKNNKVISGVVTGVAENGFQISSDDNRQYEVRLDETLTKYFQIVGAQKKEIKNKDIAKGNYILVTGVINDNSITANVIYVDEQFLVESGKITEVNKEDFSLKVITAGRDNYILSIETNTKQQILNIKTLEVERVGFSKIKEGDTIHFVIKKTGKEKNNQYSAQRILIIPQEFFMK